MSKFIQFYIFLFIIFSIIFISNSQFLDKNVLKAAGCITLVKKLKNKPSDQRVITSFLLSCFINIDEDTANKLLQSQYYDNMGIEESQIMQLIDFNSIQKRFTDKQIEEYSKALNTALEPLRDKGKGNSQAQQYNSYDQDYQNPEEEDNNNEGLVELITNNITSLFTSTDSILLLFVVFGIFYFCLQKMRKWFGNNDTDDKNSSYNKKNNKNNKNSKKKKK